MRTEHSRILIECLTRQNAIAAAPEPPAYKWWEVEEHLDAVAYGPRYLPAEWFGPLRDAERQRYMRAVYDLDRDGLLIAYKTEGNRLQRVKLTDAGKAKAAELSDGRTVSSAVPTLPGGTRKPPRRCPMPSWEDSDCFFVRAWVCRKCGCRLYDKTRTDRQTYATIKKVKCRKCKRRCKIIIENTQLPDSGSDDF